MKPKTTEILGIYVILPLAFFFACGGPGDREEVLELLTNLTHFAEERDAAAILAKLTDDYADFEGRSKSGAEALLADYFDHYRGIAINILRSRVDELEGDQAVVRADLAFSSGAGKVFRKFARVSFDNYRLKVKLRKSGGEWLVAYAEWRPVGIDELLSGPDR